MQSVKYLFISVHLSLYLVAFPTASLRNSQVVCNIAIPTLSERRTPETWQTKNVPLRPILASAPSSVPTIPSHLPHCQQCPLYSPSLRPSH